MVPIAKFNTLIVQYYNITHTSEKALHSTSYQ